MRRERNTCMNKEGQSQINGVLERNEIVREKMRSLTNDNN